MPINEIARINSVINQTIRNIARDQSHTYAAGQHPRRSDDATILREQILPVANAI
jgi:hypothetical protein